MWAKGSAIKPLALLAAISDNGNRIRSTPPYAESPTDGRRTVVRAARLRCGETQSLRSRLNAWTAFVFVGLPDA
jgi:hypothetical protein